MTPIKSDELKIIRPGQGHAIHWLGSRSTFLTTSETTASAYTIWTDEPRPGDGPAPHVHSRDEEFFYVLEGELTFWCAGHSYVGRPGAFIGLPKGIGHQFRNDSSNPARTIIATIPGGIEKFFLELGNPYSQPHDATMPPDIKRITAVAKKAGQTIAEPSLRHPIPGPASVDLPLGIGRAPTFRAPGEGESFAANNLLITLKTVGPQTLGGYTLVEIELSPGTEFPAHRHPRYAEALYILDGEVSLNTDAQTSQVGPDSVVIIPPGTPHLLANTTDRPARLISLTTPAGIEDFYRSACRPVHARPARPSVEPGDAERLAELAPQFGIDLV